MSFLAVPLLVFMMWPFHSHHMAAPQPPIITIGPQLQPGELVAPENLCEHDDTYGWSLSGPDGETGFSTESCQKAFENWKSLPVNRIVLSRV